VISVGSLCSDARTVEVGDDISAKDAVVKDGEFPGTRW
jgi:hypothetical protein